MPHAPYIDMNEIWSRVISDATPMQCQRRIPKCSGIHSRYANIDSHRLHVQTVLRHAMSVVPQVFIAPRRTVAAHHIDLSVRTSYGRQQVVQQIKYSSIVRAYLARPVVPQVTIHPRESVGVVSIPVTIRNLETFSGVRVKEV